MHQAFVRAAALALALTTAPACAERHNAAQITAPRAVPGAAPELGDLFDLADLGDFHGALALSPDLQRIAFVQRRTLLSEDRYVYEIGILSLGDGRVTMIAGAGGLLLAAQDGVRDGSSRDRRPVWSPDASTLAFLVEDDGEGVVGLYDTASASLARIRSPHAEMTDIQSVAWRDAAHLEMTATPGAHARERSRIESHANGFAPDPRYAPLYSALPILTEETHWQFDLASRHWRQSAGEAPRDQTSSAIRIAPRDEGLSRAAQPPRAIFFRRPGQSREIRCADPQCEGALVGAWQDGARLLFLKREGFAERLLGLYVWDTGRQTVTLLRREEEALLDCKMAERALICLRETSSAPRTIARIDTETGALSILYDPNPNWRDFALPRLERIEARDVFGEESFAYLVYPADYEPERRYPLVIVQYRARGFLRGGVGNETPIFPLAARGFAVLSIDRPEPRALRRRLSPAALTRRTALDGSENIMKQSAMEAMLDQLESRGLIDPDRVAITGLSDGAETLYHGLMHSRRFAAAVAGSPPTDALDWYLNAQTFRDQRSADIGLSWPDPLGQTGWARWWRDNSAVLNADRIETPLLMQLADSEALSAYPLVSRLRDLERPIDLYVYPGAYHLKTRPRHLALAQIRTLDWIAFWLRDEESNDPTDAERRTRWRALRRPS